MIKPNPDDYIHTSILLTHISATQTGVKVLLSNHATIQASRTGKLDIPSLPPEARTSHIFTELASGSLLLIGQLCDHGCSAYFDKYKLYIIQNVHIIVQGSRGASKLCTIDSQETPIHSLNSTIGEPTIA